MAELYKIIRMREIPRMTDDMRMEKYFHIEAQTAGGVFFTEDIPEADMNEKAVKTVLDKKAKELDAIKGS